MDRLPMRGAGVRELGLALPPDPMPGRRGLRPLKSWRYVGAYSPAAMVCAVEASVGNATRRWWAVALPDGALSTHTPKRRGVVVLEPGRAVVRDRGMTVDLLLEEGAGVECVSPEGESYAWTRKQGGVPVRGVIRGAGVNVSLDGAIGVVDDSAGYHRRHTDWCWSAGVGQLVDGRPVAWNLVAGLHDGEASERTLWVDGEPHEVGPVEFAEDLTSIDFAEEGSLRCTAWAVLEHSQNALLVRSRYRQPFGSFAGKLPGGFTLAAGHGVMEHHSVCW